MSLGSVRWLSGDGQDRSGAYRSLMTARVFRAFQRVTMNVGNSVSLEVGSDGVGVHDIVTNGRNCWVFAFCKFLLKAKS